MGENRTERANIPITLEMKFCLRCHILSQEDDATEDNTRIIIQPVVISLSLRHYLPRYYIFAAIPGIEPGRYV